MVTIPPTYRSQMTDQRLAVRAEEAHILFSYVQVPTLIPGLSGPVLQGMGFTRAEMG